MNAKALLLLITCDDSDSFSDCEQYGLRASVKRQGATNKIIDKGHVKSVCASDLYKL